MSDMIKNQLKSRPFRCPDCGAWVCKIKSGVMGGWVTVNVIPVRVARRDPGESFLLPDGTSYRGMVLSKRDDRRGYRKAYRRHTATCTGQEEIESWV